MTAQQSLPLPTLLMRFVVPCSPMPLQRARKGKHGWYTPQESREYKEFVARCARYQTDGLDGMALWAVRDLRPELKAVYDEPAIMICADFFFNTRRPKDVDNCQKGIGDALVDAGVIRSDAWTVLRGWSAASHYDPRNPRAELEIHRAQPLPPKRGKR